MKKNYFAPVLKVTEFEAKDVLKVSGAIGDRYDYDDFAVLDGFGE